MGAPYYLFFCLQGWGDRFLWVLHCRFFCWGSSLLRPVFFRVSASVFLLGGQGEGEGGNLSCIFYGPANLVGIILDIILPRVLCWGSQVKKKLGFYLKFPPGIYLFKTVPSTACAPRVSVSGLGVGSLGRDHEVVDPIP